jgi:phage terminase small subunit
MPGGIAEALGRFAIRCKREDRRRRRSVTRELTALQRGFVTAYVGNGGNGTKAAEAAGYSPHSARQLAGELLSLPHVCAALHAERERRIARIATASLDVLEGVLLDDDAATAQRVKVALAIIDRAGHTVPKRSASASEGGKDQRNMTREELESSLRTLASAIESARHPTIDAEAETIEVDGPLPPQKAVLLSATRLP